MKLFVVEIKNPSRGMLYLSASSPYHLPEIERAKFYSKRHIAEQQVTNLRQSQDRMKTYYATIGKPVDICEFRTLPVEVNVTPSDEV